MTFDIKRAWTRLMELHENPLMPIILQEAYGKLDKLGQAMASRGDRRRVSEYWDKLTQAWPEDGETDEFEEVSSDPDFIIALAGMLCESLRSYVRKVME